MDHFCSGFAYNTYVEQSSWIHFAHPQHFAEIVVRGFFYEKFMDIFKFYVFSKVEILYEAENKGVRLKIENGHKMWSRIH